jgi:hypothetical protein
MIFLRLFKNNRTLGVVVVLLSGIGLYIPSFIGADSPGEMQGMPLYTLLFGSVHILPFLDRILGLVFTLIIAVILIRIGIRFALLETRSYMPAIFFVLFSMALPDARQLSPAMVGSVFFLLSISSLFDVHDKRADTFSIFASGFLLALGSMFYLKLIWFLPLFWLTVITMRATTWREMVYPLVAYALMAILLITWFWGIRDNGQGLLSELSKNIAFEGGFTERHFSGYLLYGYFLLLVAIASIYMVNRFQSRKTIVQNIYQALFYMFVAGVIFFVFIARFQPADLVFVVIPSSFILTYFFHRKKNHWSHELALWILVGLLIYTQLMS